MDRDPSNRSYEELLLGTQVLIEYLAGPAADSEEDWDKLRKGEALPSPGPEARTRLLWLTGYSRFGIEGTVEPEPGNEMFISWSSVLRIHGLSREELVQFAREYEAAKRQESSDTEE